MQKAERFYKSQSKVKTARLCMFRAVLYLVFFALPASFGVEKKKQKAHVPIASESNVQGKSQKKTHKLVQFKVATCQLKPEERHGDYIQYVPDPPKEKTIHERVFDPTVSREMKERYKSFAEKYEFRSHYQQNSEWEENQYAAQNQALGDWTFRRLLEYHIEKFVQEPPKESKAAQSVASTVQTVRAIQNSQVQFSPETKARFRFDPPGGQWQAGLTSPLVDTTMEYRTRPINPLSGFGAEPGEPLSVLASKQITPIGAATSVRYGVYGETLNYSISKQLNQHWTAQVEENQFLRDPSRDETIWRLNFGTTIDSLFSNHH